MRHILTISAILGSLAPLAAAQSGAEVTVPAHSQQSRAFPFANICSTVETFKVTAQPETDWLRFEPAMADVQPGTPFVVHLTANSGNHAPGAYHASMKVLCASCAVSDPPCFQSVTDFPVRMTVANIAFPGEFEPVAGAANPATMSELAAASRPALYIPPAAPPPSSGNTWFAVVGGGLLLVGVSVMVLAISALKSDRKLQPAIGGMSAESERHRVRR